MPVFGETDEQQVFLDVVARLADDFESKTGHKLESIGVPARLYDSLVPAGDGGFRELRLHTGSSNVLVERGAYALRERLRVAATVDGLAKAIAVAVVEAVKMAASEAPKKKAGRRRRA